MGNPSPVGFDAKTNAGSYYTVQPKDCLWNIALAEVKRQRQAAGLPPLAGKALEQATAAEMGLIFDANPQIVGRDGSGTYDLIFAGDKINIPNSPHVAGQAPQAGALPGFVKQGPQGQQVPALVLPAGTVLQAGESQFSPDGQYKLIMQPDGNLVVYKIENGKETPIFASGTYVNPNGTPNPYGLGVGHRAVMQTDGNLVVYDQAGKALWASDTAGEKNAQFAIQNDGNIVIYGAAGPVWDGRSHNVGGRLYGDVKPT